MSTKENSKRLHYKRADNIAGYILLAPWLIGFILMWFLPALVSIYYSLTDFNMLNTPTFIGMKNYIRIFSQDDTFRQALKVTFTYVLILVPCRPSKSIENAGILNKAKNGSK